MKYPEIKEIARKLRNNPTPSEKKLWSFLRNRKLNGKKFLRQHPIFYDRTDNEHFFYIPDFYCAEIRLIIEVDGRFHEYQKDRDKHRDEILHGLGLKILRIKNEELLNMDKVLHKIREMF